MKNVRHYFSWRQVDTHINNLYNTTFSALVLKSGLKRQEEADELEVCLLYILYFMFIFFLICREGELRLTIRWERAEWLENILGGQEWNIILTVRD